MSEERFESIVIGAGPGGRHAARALVGRGIGVAMIEAELVGGECPYWACIPAKALLRPPEAQEAGRRVPGLEMGDLDWEAVREYRDYMNSGLDDSKKTASYEELGITIIRGEARLEGDGRVVVGDRTLRSDQIVLAPGTTSSIPPIEGIDDVEYWTNREATTFDEVPASVIVLGGGPVGVELGQMLSRFGSNVSIVESAPRPLAREDPAAGDLIARLLREEGIELWLGQQAEAVRTTAGGVAVQLSGGDEIAADHLIVATGREPRVDGLGLEQVGIEPGKKGIEVDERCRAGDGIWAVGDVTGVAQFTHVASYQGRIAAADIAGERVKADYRAVPRVVFSDPEVAAVGLTAEQAADEGLDVASAQVDLSETDRTETYGKGLQGAAGLVADRGKGVLVGAWAVGPLASEWISAAVVAVKAEVPIAVLEDTMFQFPTFSELIPSALKELDSDHSSSSNTSDE